MEQSTLEMNNSVYYFIVLKKVKSLLNQNTIGLQSYHVTLVTLFKVFIFIFSWLQARRVHVL